jgi:hypothetical protein
MASSTFCHWDHLIEIADAKTMVFYKAVEEAIERRRIPDSSRSRIDYREGGLLSAKREYLRVKRLTYTFDICGAPSAAASCVVVALGTHGLYRGPAASEGEPKSEGGREAAWDRNQASLTSGLKPPTRDCLN